MPLFSFEGKQPRVHPTAFVEENAPVWYNAVLRVPDGMLARRHRTGVAPV